MRIYTLFHFAFVLLFLTLCRSYVYGHSKEKSKVLVISFDGFRHDYFDLAEKFQINLKTFKKIFKLGIKAHHMKNVFVTKTFPNHMSLITGCYEETHGMIDNVYFDPFFNETFSYFNFTQSLQSKWFSNSEPLWATNIMNGHKSAIVYWPGQLAPYLNRISPTFSFGVYNEKLPLNYKIDVVLNWLSEEKTTLGFLYHPEPDGVGHIFGPDSKMIVKQLEKLDNSLQYLLDQIESRSLKSQLNVVVVTDHGMAAISNSKRVLIDNYIDRSLYHDYHDMSYTLWSIWPKVGTNISDIMQRLNSTPHVTAFRKEDIPKEWHYRNNRAVAPVVLLAEPGWAMVHTAADVVKSKGTHGYSTSSSDMDGIFFAWGPDIAVSNRSAATMRAIDVFPLVAEILKFEYVPNINGSLANVRWMLRNGGDETGIFTSLVIICALSLITVLSACIVVSCAHYNANALRVQKMGNTYVLKSGSLVRKWQEGRGDPPVDRNSNSYKYKKSLSKKSKMAEADAAFLLESNDEDEILGDMPSGAYKFNS